MTEKTQNHPQEHLAHGRATLDAMMEILRPFLPPVDLSLPEPAKDWRLTKDFQPIGAGNEKNCAIWIS